MNLHQVLTGAVNPGDHCFSVGSIGDQRFTAYASGCDIVILGSDFERLQIIPGAKHGNIQVGCVDCSMQQGKIAASYGNVISIFEPVNLPKQKKNLELYSQWQKSGQFFLESIAHNITWDPTGSRLLTGSSYLQLWSNTNLEKPTEDENLNKTDLNFGDWRCIWHCKTASQVHLMKFSPDGEFFATAGKDDCLLKVWYNVENWRTAVTSPDRSSEKQSQGETDFSFVYLAHPRAVNGFSWRKTSKYMPRASVCNVLLTCCKDNVCRLWVETFLPNDCLLYGGDYSHWTESINLTNNFKRNASSKERVQNALEVNLRHFRRGRRRSLALVAHTGYLPHQQDPHHVHRSTPLHANALCHFHIAASINPATDIPLLPSITSLSLNENEEKTGPFVVHWLNNKELHFTLSMEVFLQQLRKSFEQPSSEASVEDSNQADVKSDEETDDGVDDLKINPEKKELGCDKMVPNSSFTSLSSAAIDHQIEVLLSEWSKNADMLFSIHPMDGSLLVWHVDWLDEYQPGMFRQVQVSFVSRIPVAFPTGDANSLCKSIMMYACTKNVDLAIQQGKQKPSGLTRSTSMLISSGHNKSSNSLKLSIFTPNVMMISKHADGSLNQWLVSFAEESAFSTVLSISHKSRYCGHRFHLNDLACHSVLPLLLTTSHHNALRTPDVDNPKQPFDALNIEECSWTQQNKSTVDVAFQDPNAVYSELILWRVDPVGPLSFSGGVSELARINSLHVSAFSNVAWLPTLIPSYCLGAYCNSPSACFVASDGQYLRLYEAVIDAKKLLSELSNPEISKYVGEVFNIVSQQSTARPGCIIALDTITKLHGRKTQLLHVFQEDFILNNIEKKRLGKDNISSNAGSSSNGFSEKFYLIVIECTQDNRSLLHMWNLHLKSIPVSLDEKVDTKLSEAVWRPEEHYSSSPEKILSPFSQKYQACRANLQSTSKLTLFSEMVYSQELHLPEGVEIISIKPSAGHLSSSSIYPACSAPYLLATSCSDEKVRFWRCRVTDGQSATSKNGKIDLAYIWEEWPLLIEDGLQSNSSITVPGRPIEVSCAHTNRLAVAYKQPASNSRSSQDFVMHVSIFECESTGGSCWVLEQTIHLDELSTVLDSGISVDSNLVAYNKQEIYISSKENITSNTKHLVHLDWMSREDGSHILTVGIGSKLFMYGPLAGKVQDQTAKESLAFPLWESTKVVPLSKFVLLRSVDLVSSVDGSPPFPVSLSWVRDGILVVGMDCEMHVYSQWQPSSKQEPIITDSYSGSTPSITSLMKQSNSSSGLHPPKKTLTRSMTSLAQKICGKKTAFDPSVDMEDSGLFEAAHVLSPTLPQYHPLQLLELMDLGKVRRAKAILSHLVKCIAGEVVALNEAESNHERRLRSLTISASGSTTRDPQAFNKAENTDYTEIDSVPPLPLYALLAADDDSCYSSLEKSGNESTLSKSNQLSKESYDELFQIQPVMTDTHMLETDEENTKPRVIDLSQYSPTYFGPEHAQVLSGHLLHSSLPGLSRMEQMSLMALADTIATTSTDIGESRDRSQGGETLDECGLKFLLAVRLHTFLTTSLPAYRAQLLHQGLSTSHFAWAFHSVAEEELLNMLPAVQKDDPTWSELRAMGVGWWVRNTRILRKCIEKVAKAAFYRKNDPLDAAIFYLAMKKKAVIWGLYRAEKNTRMTQFFGHNFEDERWRKAALKNAFSLLGKQRFEHSAAFFLLAGCLRDAIEVCLEKLNDIQLALVIARLYESEFDTSATYKSILHKKVLGIDSPVNELCSLNINMHHDPFLRSMAYWILEDYSGALETLIKQPIRENDDQVLSACNPTVFNFYNYLRTHPLLLRRHFGSSDTFSTHMNLTGKSGLAGTINLSERRLFFTTASAHLKAGCPMLALEVLSKMPKVIKKTRPFCRASSFLDTSKDSSPSSPLKLDAREDKSSAVDWSQSLINGFGSSSEGSSEKQSNSTLSFDWSQPSVVFQDDSLELKWDSDNDEENEDVPISMKELKPLQRKTDKKLDDVSSNYTESFSTLDENDLINPSEDIIAVQLKFRACLKILTVELRTLSTGYEIDGGKLRYQLYHWLEKEVIALQRTCDFCSDAEELQSAFGRNEDEFGLNEDAEDLPHQTKVKQLRENFQEKRQWLLKYQSLLRMFLSYCILHGSHGGGLASVRMELILLLQESQQETSEPLFSSPLSEQTSVPLLFACTANAKTVVANPLLHLSNLTHDILHAIINFDSPPHPDTQSNKVYVMHTLAASLSACIYQCLCGSHNYSSFQTNQFTGMVYQTVLLPHRHSLKTGSLDEAITPNTSPAQWPGITCLIRLLNSSGEEAQSGLTVLLCEILTAVYLSLFIHGLATHSSNELFRIVAHPLNEKMWSAVFGGGAHVPSKEQTHSKALPVSSLVEEGEKQNKRFRSSKMSCGESAPLTPSSAPVSQESLAVKEKFIPPELSIWDYFIAKPFLPPSQSRAEYDSEESLGSDDDDDDDDDDVLASDFHLQEHSNSNSYSWSLMRLAMVQLVLNNLKTFYPFAGHDLAELPVSSPLCHAVLKTLQCWEQVLLRRLEIHGGPPQNYIASHTSEESLSAGPAILRHKALLEPTNTPFKSKHHLALSVKRLWQYLVKQEEIQETFIKNIFTKKRCLHESLEDNSETIKNSMMEEPNINKIEADLGYPGGKARIIHKESDIITAFAVNKANRNCIAIASSHDVQELDVSGILATQIYTWVDDDIEVETKGSEDFLVIHARDDLTAVQGTTPYTHSNPGTPINMPWLGSTQTGRGASVMIKKAINNVRRMTSHPTLPYYLTGAQDGSVRMFEWGHSQQIACFRSGGNSRVTRMRFNYQGNKFGIVDADGYLSLYQTNWKCCPVTGSMPKPYLTWQCHNKTANDFVFVSSSSLIATAGLSTDNRNVCLWDTLVAPANSLVHAFTCHDNGATVLAYAPKHQLLISGGRKGFTYAFDLCQRQQRQLFQSHDSPVKAIAVDPTEEYFVTGSAEGNIKIWSLSTFGLLHTFVSEHARQSIFRNIGTGVMQIETGPANHIFSCGADGTMKMRILPDQFSPLNEVLKNDVKFML
ncbi:dmX-like protein 1 isoform X1 [Trachypithecus francoisi]|uniref:dmX-like protein 1 isoform X1 n=1 Tax=Trachypithecus francoisi TaxID=54180 RepID=UPI00141B2CD8|nr:dmX-like protein 1 isoform X1 [Trachypithecus francoisi]XP_033037363.1 dmX-like protein 1 isoform X1 [Trachypithecus francoisi]